MSQVAEQPFRMELGDQEYLRIRGKVDFDDLRFQEDYRALRAIHDRPGKMNEGALMLLCLRQRDRKKAGERMRAGKKSEE